MSQRVRSAVVYFVRQLLRALCVNAHSIRLPLKSSHSCHIFIASLLHGPLNIFACLCRHRDHRAGDPDPDHARDLGHGHRSDWAPQSRHLGVEEVLYQLDHRRAWVGTEGMAGIHLCAVKRRSVWFKRIGSRCNNRQQVDYTWRESTVVAEGRSIITGIKSTAGRGRECIGYMKTCMHTAMRMRLKRTRQVAHHTD